MTDWENVNQAPNFRDILDTSNLSTQSQIDSEIFEIIML